MRGILITAGILCLLAWSGTASADSTEVVTLDFSGTGTCFVISSCGPGTTVVGTYSFDPDTSSIVGPWSFSTPFGTFSSSESGASAGVQESDSLPPDPMFGIPWPSGYDILSFGTTAGGVDLGFADPQDYFGPIATSIQSGPVTFVFSDAFEFSGTAIPNFFNLTSGTATPVAPTPEPSTLALLGVALLGLPLLRYRAALRTRVDG